MCNSMFQLLLFSAPLKNPHSPTFRLGIWTCDGFLLLQKNACGFVIFCLLQMHLFIIFNLRMIDGKYKGDLDENRRLFSNYANISKIVFETD